MGTGVKTAADRTEALQLIGAHGGQSAPLPERYEAARNALAECERIDECAKWAKKAHALASYARQAEDKTLEAMAVRIRARAIRRCGELLNEIPAKAHGSGIGEGVHLSSERDQAAKEAGLSRGQKIDALRVARIPAETFEQAVESERPPTVTKLAELGTRKKPAPLIDIEGRSPEEYNRSLLFGGALRDLADTALHFPPESLLQGSVPRQYDRLGEHASFLVDWLRRFLILLRSAK